MALSILALSMIGFTYALWSDTLYISGSIATGEVDWGLFPQYNFLDHQDDEDWLGDCNWTQWESDKDVGGPTIMTPIDTDKDGDMDTLQVTLQNTYPGYFENIGFHAKCLGTIPIIIDNVVINGNMYREDNANPTVFIDLTGEGDADIKIGWGDNLGVQYHPWDLMPMEFSFFILVLQPAPQGATLTFDITLTAVQYNEYVPP